MTVWAEEGLSCRGFPVAPKRGEGGFVHYDNGQTAEVSWSFIRELPPKNSK
jgi:hypothetical protein